MSAPRVVWLEDDPPAVLDAAVQALAAEQVVVFPTDTVYGLLAASASRVAYQRIYALKGRGFDKPLALLVSKQDPAWYDLYSVAATLNEGGAFSGGELTIVIAPHEDSAYSAEIAVIQPGPIGMRSPIGEQLQSLLQHSGRVWATSVNRSGQPSATTADEVLAWVEELRQHGIDPPELVVLSRTPGSGKPSRVVDLTSEEPKWIR